MNQPIYSVNIDHRPPPSAPILLRRASRPRQPAAGAASLNVDDELTSILLRAYPAASAFCLDRLGGFLSASCSHIAPPTSPFIDYALSRRRSASALGLKRALIALREHLEHELNHGRSTSPSTPGWARHRRFCHGYLEAVALDPVWSASRATLDLLRPIAELSHDGETSLSTSAQLAPYWQERQIAAVHLVVVRLYRIHRGVRTPAPRPKRAC